MAVVYSAEMILPVLIIFSLFHFGLSIRCYECDSNEDLSCPAWRYFDPRLNALIDCGSFEAHVPGLFCMKIYRESTGWHSWIKITRRCGSRTATGMAWGCQYWFEDQGVYKEVCYCQDKDGCNSAPRGVAATISFWALLTVTGITLYLSRGFTSWV